MIFCGTVQESLMVLQQWIVDLCDQHSMAVDIPELEQIVQTELDGIFITALTESLDSQSNVEFEHILELLESLPAGLSRKLRLCLNDALKEKSPPVPLPKIVTAHHYLKCSFSGSAVNDAFSLHSDFYLSEIQVHLSQESEFSCQLLKYFDEKLQPNPLVTGGEENRALNGLIDICIDQAFLDADQEMYMFNFEKGRNLIHLKKYVLDRVFSQRATPEPLAFLSEQRQFSTSAMKKGRDYESLVTDLHSIDILFDLTSECNIPELMKVTASLINYRQDLHAQFYRNVFIRGGTGRLGPVGPARPDFGN